VFPLRKNILRARQLFIILGVFLYSKISITFLKFPRSTCTDSVYDRIAPYYIIQYYGRIFPWPNRGKYDRNTVSCKSSHFLVNNRLWTCKFDLGYPHAQNFICLFIVVTQAGIYRLGTRHQKEISIIYERQNTCWAREREDTDAKSRTKDMTERKYT